MNQAQKHQDRRKGTPSEDPSSRPSRCGGTHGVRHQPQTTAATSHSTKYAPMHHEGGMTHISKTQHATYYTPRTKNGKEQHQNLSPPQPTEIICRLRNCNTTQLHKQSPHKGKDLTAALHEKPDFTAHIPPKTRWTSQVPKLNSSLHIREGGVAASPEDKNTDTKAQRQNDSG